MKQLFAVPILIFLSFVFAGYFIAPQYFELAELKKEVSFRERQLENSKQRLSDIEKILKELDKHQESLDKIEAALPNGAGLPALFSFLQKQSSASGLVLENLNPESKANFSEEESGLKESRVSINVLGLLSSIEDYFRALEKSSRLIEIENVVISQEDGEEVILSCGLSIKVYHY